MAGSFSFLKVMSLSGRQAKLEFMRLGSNDVTEAQYSLCAGYAARLSPTQAVVDRVPAETPRPVCGGSSAEPRHTIRFRFNVKTFPCLSGSVRECLKYYLFLKQPFQLQLVTHSKPFQNTQEKWVGSTILSTVRFWLV